MSKDLTDTLSEEMGKYVAAVLNYEQWYLASNQHLRYLGDGNIGSKIIDGLKNTPNEATREYDLVMTVFMLGSDERFRQQTGEGLTKNDVELLFRITRMSDKEHSALIAAYNAYKTHQYTSVS